MTLVRHLISATPFPRQPEEPGTATRPGSSSMRWNLSPWPARWITHASLHTPPAVLAFRCRFHAAAASELTLHVSADERYELFLDGQALGCGPERGDRLHWHYETYRGRVEPGDHVLVARVRAMGSQAPMAQLSFRPGLIVAAQGPLADQIHTAPDHWQAKVLGGYVFIKRPGHNYTGALEDVHGQDFDWDHEQGTGNETTWQPVTDAGPVLDEDRWMDFDTDRPKLTPASLPPMMDAQIPMGIVRHVSTPTADADLVAQAIDPAAHLPALAQAWQTMIDQGQPLTVPAHTVQRVLLDLDNYVCGYPVFISTGGRGATLDIHWEEALYESYPDTQNLWREMIKGHRDQVDHKFFRNYGDRFRPDGGANRRFTTLWWRAGRYVQVTVRTAGDPVTLHRLALRETRYPLEAQGGFTCSDDRINRVIPIMWRGVQASAHETYCDSPFYEQLMYVGDTRLESLVTTAMSSDQRLPRKAVRMFGQSLDHEGLTASRYPCRSHQVIAPFALWWVGMVHDFATWRGDQAFVREQMPAVRAVLERFNAYRNRDGLVEKPRGWNYMDWVRRAGWDTGNPPGACTSISGMINWQFAWLLSQAAELETWLGTGPELASRWRRLSQEVAGACDATFWDEGRQLYADEPARQFFSEHSQCLALLSGQMPAARVPVITQGLFTATDLAPTSIYFSYYLLETVRVTRRMDRFFHRLEEWFELSELGFKTTREAPEPSRSDCHGWGGHPLFHLLTTVLGIRPAGMGFTQLFLDPQLGPLQWAKGTFMHEKGPITVDLRQDGSSLSGTVTLPAGLTGQWVRAGKPVALHSGENRLG